MTIDELRSAAAIVRDATEEGENTATRIGQLFLDTIETLGDVQIADDLVTDDAAKVLSARQGKVLGETTVKKAQRVFEVADDLALSTAQKLSPFLDIAVYGDIDTLTSFTTKSGSSTVAYTSATQSTSNIAIFSITVSGSSSDFSIQKQDVSSSLGVQRIVKECVRGNLYFVFTIDFSLMETYNGALGAAIPVGMWCKKKSYNPFVERRSHLCAGYVGTDVEDTYQIGDKLYVKLADGVNTFSHLTTRLSATNYNAQRTELKVNSYGVSVVEILKVDEGDWVLMRRLLQVSDGKVVDEREGVIGAYTGGIISESELGLTSSTSAFTMVIKFRTPKSWGSSAVFLFSNTVIGVSILSRHTLYVSSGSSALVESAALKLDTDYTAIITFDDGDVYLSVGGAEKTATGKSLTGTEYFAYLGSSRSGGTPYNPYPGIIEGMKIYTSVVTDEDELKSVYSEHSDLILNLQPESVFEDCWLDLSGEQHIFAPRVQDGRISVVLETQEGAVAPDTIDMERINLFSTSNVLYGYLADTGNGKIGEWNPEVRGQYAAVAKIPAIKDKYYCIINPYWNAPPSRIGVMNDSSDFGNPSQHNIVFCGRKYAVAKAAYVYDSVPVDTMTFNLYRTSINVPYPIETPLVEVYEMASKDEAIAYIKSRFGENKELASNINIDRKILASDHVGTLSSMYADKSMLLLGDSITATHGWSDYVADRLKWPGIHNIAIGGANIAGQYNPNDNTSPRNLIYQIRQSANLLGDVCYVEGELESGVYVKKIDYVFISMGFNDAKNGRTVGSLSDVKDVSWSTLAPSSDTVPFATVAAAIKYCIFYLKTTLIPGTITVDGVTKNVAIDCRTAKIMWQTPIATTDNFITGQPSSVTDSMLLAVENVITEVCEYYSVPVVNGRKLCGVSREEEELYEGGKYLADNIHPNDKGHIKLGEMNLGAILSNF